MQISAAPIIYILIFIAVIVLVEGLYLTVFGKSISLNNKVSRRLALMEKGGNREEVLEQLRKEMSQHLNAKASRSTRSWPTRHKRPTSPFRPRP